MKALRPLSSYIFRFSCPSHLLPPVHFLFQSIPLLLLYSSKYFVATTLCSITWRLNNVPFNFQLVNWCAIQAPIYLKTCSQTQLWKFEIKRLKFHEQESISEWEWIIDYYQEHWIIEHWKYPLTGLVIDL